jgi:alpha-1,3-mannosyltransferase
LAFFGSLADDGKDIRKAQLIFAALYLVAIGNCVADACQGLEVSKARTSRVHWSWRIAMGDFCLSKRVHSIFVLRLFNDGVAMLLLYISIYLFLHNY